MKFIALLKQHGYGCDYTIGCGRTWIDIEAPDQQAAMDALRARVCDEYSGELTLKSAVLFLAESRQEAPVAAWYAEDNAQTAALALAERERKERAEFERLSKKFAP